MIDTSNWKEFKISDLGFTNYHGVRQTKAKREDGDIPLLTAGKENQGVASYIGNAPSTYEDAITVDMFGNSFFHKGIYAGDDNIYFFVNEELSDYAKIFISSVLNTVNTKLYAFKEQFRQPQADALTVKLPATPDGQPDWNYMESYMKAVMEESEKSLENLKRADDTKHLIDVSGWGEFRVGDLFEKLDLKCRKKFNKATDVSTEQTEEFNLPLVNAKHNNNGIMYYGRSDDWDSAEMTIDIVGDGAASTGDVYAQPQRTGVLYNAYLVKPLWNCTSEYVLQFMACVIERCVKSHFGYENKCTWDKVSQESIWLPITSTGEPDWQYMEDYMRSIMNKSEKAVEDLRKAV